VNLQMSVHRLHTETSQVMKNTFLELDDVSRERHDEVLDMSRMSEKERELLTTLLDCAQFGKISIAFFFLSPNLVPVLQPSEKPVEAERARLSAVEW